VLANCVPFRAGEFGFTVDCVAQCENLLSIDQAQLQLGGGPRGVLDNAALRKIVKASGYVIESTCEPSMNVPNISAQPTRGETRAA